MGNQFWTKEEEQALAGGFLKHGKQWERIKNDPQFSKQLVRRSVNGMKSKWERGPIILEKSEEAVKDILEVTESPRLCSEIQTAKSESQHELELSRRDTELMSAKEEINRLKRELSSYKVNAKALLHKNDAELSAVKDAELLKAQEDAVKRIECLEAQLADALADGTKAAETISSLEAKMRSNSETFNTELMAAKEEITRLESELSSYKNFANGLLQKKDAELSTDLKICEECVGEGETKNLKKVKVDKRNALSSRVDNVKIRAQNMIEILENAYNPQTRKTTGVN